MLVELRRRDSARLTLSQTRQKVLAAAFTRSLRDPFVHARSAALMALGATIDIFSVEDCAARILPAVCPLLIDKEKYVTTVLPTRNLTDQEIESFETKQAAL